MSRSVIDRTSLSCGESRQMSTNFMRRTLPLGKRKLHAGINVSIGRNIAGRVPGAAWQHVQGIFVRTLRRSAKFLDVSDQGFVAEDLAQRGLVHIQIENGPVSVHHRGDRGIHDELRAQFRGQRLHARDSRPRSGPSAHWP